jgi:hypothetical protein
MEEGTMVSEHRVFSAMQEGKPYKRYIKTVLGKVFVTILNPFSGKPEGVILAGRPQDEKSRDEIVVNVWTAKEDVFFKRMNKAHFQSGNIRELAEEVQVVEKASPNEISEDEIFDLLNKPFLALKNKLERFTSVAPVFRVLAKAEELEKSEKILEAIRARVAELEVQE